MRVSELLDVWLVGWRIPLYRDNVWIELFVAQECACLARATAVLDMECMPRVRGAIEAAIE
jgi:hypothetical protein